MGKSWNVVPEPPCCRASGRVLSWPAAWMPLAPDSGHLAPGPRGKR